MNPTTAKPADIRIQGRNYRDMCAAAGVRTPRRRMPVWASYVVFAGLAVGYLFSLGLIGH